MKNLIISNPEALEAIKRTITKEGSSKLHIVTDFDRTLTAAFVNGNYIPSLISVLRDGNYLTSDYAEKAHALYDKYHVIEVDPSTPLAEKKKAMQEWWTAHFNLLIESRLNRRDLEKVVSSGKVKFRKGALSFIDFLHQHNIPLVILSSAGLGEESISRYLENKRRRFDNISIISNSFEWDRSGYLVGFKEPIIHCMNKDETSIRKFPFYNEVKNRRNVLLLGDSLEDVGMVNGFPCRNLIKIGFLNEKVEENLAKYKEAYDAVILNDGPMDYVNELVRELIG